MTGTGETHPTRFIAVDWSGAASREDKKIWLAESWDGRRLTRLESGRSRAAIRDHLLHLMRETPRVVIGFDFAFSFPAWYVLQIGFGDVPSLWRRVARDGECWLAACAFPFWGRPGRRRPNYGPDDELRWTERAVPVTAGIRPKSIFHVGGAGAVGTGSIRGMPLLHALHQAGASIWPFDAPKLPMVVEIYPRLLSGPVAKSRSADRAAYIDKHFPELGVTHRASAESSEDAFDAAVSVLVMATHAADLKSLPSDPTPQLLLEGRIWHPAWRSDQTPR